MVSSVGTAAAVFGIVALAVTGKGRTGALLVVKQMLGAEGVGALSSATSAETIMLLVSVFAAALLGYRDHHPPGQVVRRPRSATSTWTG